MSSDLSRQRCVFDAYAGDFSHHCRSVAQDGEGVARADLSALWSLAEAVAGAAGVWRRGFEGLDVARAGPFDEALAAARVAEAVFDDILAPLAYGAFRAALDVVLDDDQV